MIRVRLRVLVTLRMRGVRLVLILTGNRRVRVIFGFRLNKLRVMLSNRPKRLVVIRVILLRLLFIRLICVIVSWRIRRLVNGLKGRL